MTFQFTFKAAPSGKYYLFMIWCGYDIRRILHAFSSIQIVRIVLQGRDEIGWLSTLMQKEWRADTDEDKLGRCVCV